MQIAVVAAGFSPGEADQLRRAMGAWQRSGKMELYQQKLMDGMRANGYSEEFAEAIYRQIEGFGEYGFPESHSASFALLTYVSSWLKCHHPAAFFAALINSQPMGFYQPAQLLEQAKRQRVRILPVDVMASEYPCTLERGAASLRCVSACDWSKVCARKKRSGSSLRARKRLLLRWSKSWSGLHCHTRDAGAGDVRSVPASDRASQSGVLECARRGTRVAAAGLGACRGSRAGIAAAERVGRNPARLLPARSQHRASSAGAAASAPAIARSAQAPRPGIDRQRHRGMRQRTGDSSAASADGQWRHLRFARGRNRHQQHHLLAGRFRGAAAPDHRHDAAGRARGITERERGDSRRRPTRRGLLALGATVCPANRGTFIRRIGGPAAPGAGAPSLARPQARG